VQPSIYALRELRTFIHCRLYTEHENKSKLINVKDPEARSQFVRSLLSNYVAVKEKYKLHGLPWAVKTSIHALKSALLSFDAALMLETVGAREVLEGKKSKLVISWRDGKKNKQHTLKLTQLLADMHEICGSLEACGADTCVSVMVSVAESVVDKLGKVHALTKVLRDSFQILVHMQSGPAFYPMNIIPDGLHLLIRWCEKLVNLEALLKVALLGNDSVAVDTFETVGVSGTFTTDKAGKLETKKCKLKNSKGKDYTTVCEHPVEMAAPYLKQLRDDCPPLYEYSLLVQMAYTFPFIVYRVTVDPDFEKTYLPLCTREQLGLHLRDFGLAARYVNSALFDDKLLDPSSFVQLTISMAEHFIEGKNTAIALGQMTEAVVQQMKEHLRHTFMGSKKIYEVVRQLYGANLSEAEDVDSLDSKAKSVKKRHAALVAERQVYFKYGLDLLHKFKFAKRHQKGKDIVSAEAELRKRSPTEEEAWARTPLAALSAVPPATAPTVLFPPVVKKALAAEVAVAAAVEEAATAAAATPRDKAAIKRTAIAVEKSQEKAMAAGAEMAKQRAQIRRTTTSDRRKNKLRDELNAAVDKTGDPHVQDWNLWRLENSCSNQSPYLTVDPITVDTPPAKLQQLRRLAEADMAAVKTVIDATPGLEFLFEKGSLSQLSYSGADSYSMHGINRQMLNKPRRPAPPAATYADSDTESDADIGAEETETDRVYGRRYIRTISAFRRGHQRNRVRQRQEELSRFEIVVEVDPASVLFYTAGIINPLDLNWAIREHTRTALFFYDADVEGEYSIGIVRESEVQALEDGADRTEYPILELAEISSRRGARKGVCEAEKYQKRTSVTRIIPATIVIYHCPVTWRQDHTPEGHYKIQDEWQREALDKVDEHVSWLEEKEYAREAADEEQRANAQAGE
jgi:hypothetical protein